MAAEIAKDTASPTKDTEGPTRATTPPRGTDDAADQPFEAKADARSWLSDVETESRPGHWVNPTAGRVLFGYDADGWLARRYDFRPRSCELYTSLIKRHLEPTFGHVPLTDIPIAPARRRHAGIAKQQPTTATKAYQLLRAILTTAVAIPTELARILDEHLATYVDPEPDAVVFTGDKGAPITTQHWSRRFRSAEEAVGETDLPFHELRRLAGILAATTGASARELMARLGYSMPRAALTYQHATEERDHQIVAGIDDILEAAKWAHGLRGEDRPERFAPVARTPQPRREAAQWGEQPVGATLEAGDLALVHAHHLGDRRLGESPQHADLRQACLMALDLLACGFVGAPAGGVDDDPIPQRSCGRGGFLVVSPVAGVGVASPVTDREAPVSLGYLPISSVLCRNTCWLGHLTILQSCCAAETVSRCSASARLVGYQRLPSWALSPPGRSTARILSSAPKRRTCDEPIKNPDHRWPLGVGCHIRRQCPEKGSQSQA